MLDNTRLEFINVAFGIARAEYLQIKDGRYLAGDLSVRPCSNRLAQIEIEPECIHVSGVYHRWAGQMGFVTDWR
jgi:hypothetical protein